MSEESKDLKSGSGTGRLTRQEAFKLLHWINAQAEKIANLDRHQTAIAASHDLAFTVTANTLMGVYEDAGIPFPGKVKKDRSDKHQPAAYCTLANAVVRLSSVIAVLISKNVLSDLIDDAYRKATMDALAEIEKEAKALADRK